MSGLNKFTGNWSVYYASHLLRRTTYGAHIDTLKSFGSSSLDSCIEILFSDIQLPSPPININFENDPDVPIGETWVDKDVSQGVNGYRQASLRGWTFELMLGKSPNIREKMTMFWHNHFVTADIQDPRYSYKYIDLLRKSATGNFRQLTKDITIDPAMLIYLNGGDNTRQAPNENYARELMELFTLGKGENAGPGDYTTFTEDDVREVAKVLTGWIVVRNNLPVRSEFRLGRHDLTTKKLSHRFGNIEIPNANENEYKNLIDIIFERDEPALFISKKLYRWFVHSGIDDQVYQDVIIPMAQIIRDSDYEIKPALKALLSSEHFYDECNIGGIIKNPVDFLMNAVNQFEILLPDDAALRQRVLIALFATSSAMQMAVFQAPSVAGWQAFYQEPTFYRLWLNATSLPTRKTYTDGIASTGIPFGQYRLQVNVLNLISKFANPSDVNNILDELNALLFCKPLAQNQKDVLLSLVLLTGAPSEWTNLYNAYLQDPNNNARRQPLINRLSALMVYMMRMPEYHLS
ncbi:MAG: DUF1800 domain-containing protein [Saprospiraceae bacterium]|nr:DUF1800 domain-containing protein [Saprospiraceae bacterium]